MKDDKNLLQRFGIFVFTIALVFGAIAITMNRDIINIDAFRRWLVYGDLEVSEEGESIAFPHAGGDLASFSLTDNGVMMVSQGGTRYYSFRGDVFSERVMNYSNPMLHNGNNMAVLYDAGGKILSVYGDESEQFTHAMGQEGSILSARLNRNNWMVVVTQESGYKGVVTVYNSQFQPVMDISLSTTYVMDAFLSPDNRRIAVLTVGQTAGIFESKLLIYDLNSEEAKETLTFSGKVVLDMDYESDAIWLLCEKEIIIINTTTFQYVSWEFPNQYLKDADLGGDGFATLLLGQYRAGTANQLLTIDKDGTVLGQFFVKTTPLALSAAGNYVGYLSGDGFILLSKELEVRATLEEIRHANEVSLAKDGTALLASKQEAWLYLPN